MRVSPESEREVAAPEVREIMPAELAEAVLKRYAAGDAPRLIGLVLGVSGEPRVPAAASAQGVAAGG